MKIKPLKWTTYISDDGKTVEIAAGAFYEDYTVHKIGNQFYVRAGDWGELFNKLFNTLEEAKRAAQEDYERSVMSLFED